MATRLRLDTRRGFTLVELLVVIAIIGTLIGLLLPAIAMVKEAARSAQCKNNIRQLALACNTYCGQHGTFPPGLPSCMPVSATLPTTVNNLGVSSGAYCQGPNWMSAILEQIEEKPMSDNLRLCLNHRWNACDECSVAGSAAPDTWNGTAAPMPKILLCPSAPDLTNTLNNTATNVGLSGIPKGNYVGCYGMQYYLPEDDTATNPPFYNNSKVTKSQKTGVFEHVVLPSTTTTKSDPNFVARGVKTGHNKGTSLGAIKDGVSKTIMISEILGFDSVIDGRGAWTVGAMGCTGFTAQCPPNDTTPDAIPICDTTIVVPAKLICTQASPSSRAFATARSAHTGGVNAACADSSTRFISDSIDPNAWKAICTKYGGEQEQIPD